MQISILILSIMWYINSVKILINLMKIVVLYNYLELPDKVGNYSNTVK